MRDDPATQGTVTLRPGLPTDAEACYPELNGADEPTVRQPTRTYPRDCRLTIVTIAQRSAWTPGSRCDGSTFFPMRPCPHTRSSTPASCSSFKAAMFGLSTPLCRAL